MALNFKLWLLESFIRINDFTNAEVIYGCFYDHKLDLSLCKGLIDTLCEVFQWFLDPIYQR